MSENVTVVEGDSPLLTFQCRQRQSDGSLVPYLLTSVTEIKLIAKVSPNDADGSAVFTYTMTGGAIVVTLNGTVGAYSEMTVQVLATDMVTPRSLYYRIVVTKGGRKDTVKKGFFRIANV